MAINELGLKFYQNNVAATKNTKNVNGTEKFALEKTGGTQELSEAEPAIEELRYLALLNSTLADEPDLNTINILLEQLNLKYNNIIHTITSYLRSNGLSKDTWYDIRSEKLSESKPPMDTDRIHIPAHSDIIDNLLLMDIQKRITNLKNEINKAPNPS